MNDSTELYTCGLEMKGGLSKEINYPQQFVRADKSDFPSKAPKDKANLHVEAMRISMGK